MRETDTRGNTEAGNEDTDEVSQCFYMMETQRDITSANEGCVAKYMRQK